MRDRLGTQATRRHRSALALGLLGLAVLACGVVAWFYYSTLPYTGFELVGGSQIGAVMPASPARAAGLRVGDRIVALDGEPFRPGESYLRTGQVTMELIIDRTGDRLRVTLELRPPLASAPSDKTFGIASLLADVVQSQA